MYFPLEAVLPLALCIQHLSLQEDYTCFWRDRAAGETRQTFTCTYQTRCIAGVFGLALLPLLNQGPKQRRFAYQQVLVPTLNAMPVVKLGSRTDPGSGV